MTGSSLSKTVVNHLFRAFTSSDALWLYHGALTGMYSLSNGLLGEIVSSKEPEQIRRLWVKITKNTCSSLFYFDRCSALYWKIDLRSADHLQSTSMSLLEFRLGYINGSYHGLCQLLNLLLSPSSLRLINRHSSS